MPNATSFRPVAHFYCHDQGAYVSCSAPVMCHCRCSYYHAKHITGVKVRTLKSDDGGSLNIKTGFVDGRLVTVK